jgi:5-methylcytosine-specific restriction enzyme subunit McrC
MNAVIPDAALPVNGAHEGRMVGRIPVRNLWLLMLYASDLVRLSGEAWIKFDADPEQLPNLVAKLLCIVVERRLRRNLSSGYAQKNETLRRVRGRIDLLQTARHRLLERGHVACRFEQLTLDTPRNRFARFALERVARLVLSPEWRHTCLRLAADLALLGVGSARPTPAQLSADRFGRSDADDRLMVALSHLACDLALPTEETGAARLFRPSREIAWVRRLYEKAVAGFYAVVLPARGWTVQPGKQLLWPLGVSTAGIPDIFPGMRTDIVLDRAADGRRIVIDTKFNALLTNGWHREETLRSAYVYQIYAYLRSQEGEPGANTAEGLLLHPSVDGDIVDEAVQLQGHLIRFSTVDLSLPASKIRERLLAAVENGIEGHLRGLRKIRPSK